MQVLVALATGSKLAVGSPEELTPDAEAKLGPDEDRWAASAEAPPPRSTRPQMKLLPQRHIRLETEQRRMINALGLDSSQDLEERGPFLAPEDITKLPPLTKAQKDRLQELHDAEQPQRRREACGWASASSQGHLAICDAMQPGGPPPQTPRPLPFTGSDMLYSAMLNSDPDDPWLLETTEELTQNPVLYPWERPQSQTLQRPVLVQVQPVPMELGPVGSMQPPQLQPQQPRSSLPEQPCPLQPIAEQAQSQSAAAPGSLVPQPQPQHHDYRSTQVEARASPAFASSASTPEASSSWQGPVVAASASSRGPHVADLVRLASSPYAPTSSSTWPGWGPIRHMVDALGEKMMADEASWSHWAFAGMYGDSPRAFCG